MPLVLASSSQTRIDILAAAGVAAEAVPARVDEDAIKASLIADGAGPRDVADALAEAKARKVSAKRPDALVIGSDQVLDLKGEVLSKPASPEACLDQLRALSGKAHRLISAAVAYEGGAPAWRHVEVATLTMRVPGDDYLRAYVARNWETVRHSVGGYVIEGEGARLMAQVRGDPFTILGMPLIPLLNWLVLRGEIEG